VCCVSAREGFSKPGTALTPAMELWTRYLLKFCRLPDSENNTFMGNASTFVAQLWMIQSVPFKTRL
jgi:hypothetical protein